MEKYGFVYIWFDKKHKMYYIGSHWGYENDGYICSSNRMRNAFNRRPYDFKRKIICKIYSNRLDLLQEEYKWLSLIKKEELSKKYYNATKNVILKLRTNYKHSPETIEKMQQRAIGRIVSDETKEKIRQANLGKKYSDEINAKKGGNRDYFDIVFREKMSFAANNKSEKTRKKISENNKRLHAEGKIGMKGKKHPPETIEKMRQSALKRNLNINKETTQGV